MLIHGRRAEDVRGLLAVVTVLLTFAYLFLAMLVATPAAEVTPAVLTLASLVIGHYFGTASERSRAMHVEPPVSPVTDAGSASGVRPGAGQ